VKLFLRLAAYLKPYRLHLVGAVICGVFVGVLSAAHAWLVKPVLDRLFIEKDARMLILIPLAICVVTALKGIFQYTHAYLVRWVGTRILETIQNDLYRHILFMPIDHHMRHKTGDLIAHISYDTQMMQVAFSSVIKDLVQQSFTFVALAGVLFYQNTMLATIALVGLPLAIYPLVRFGQRLKRLAQGMQDTVGDMTGLLQETLSGIRTMKAFGREASEAARFAEKNRLFRKKVMRTLSISEMSRPIIEIVASLGIAGIVGYGGVQIFAGTMTPGAFFSFMAAATMMYGPVKNLSSAGHLLQQATAAAERIFDTMDRPNESQRDRGFRVLPDTCGVVRFENVSFRYDAAGPAILSDISFTAKLGDVVALVGSSGAGKSTLVNLIPRFFEPDAGEITIDGIPTREVTLASLRSRIGIVSQEVILFDRTVYDNIAYGAPSASEAAVRAAAEAAYAHLFIEKMPQGYQTVLSKGGMNLSGGERQRLAIARALLSNPPILILDEATSALDTESEWIVRKAMMNLVKNRTTFVIAHRLSTIQRATCILVINHGRIVERGRHDELLRDGGYYRRIYQLQFRADDIDPDATQGDISRMS